MYLNDKSKLPIHLKSSFKDKIISFRFKLKKIDYGICFIKKRRINTYFYFQNVDIIMTDKDHKILNIFANCDTESIFKGDKNTYYTYILPVGISNNYQIDNVLPIKNHSK